VILCTINMLGYYDLNYGTLAFTSLLPISIYTCSHSSAGGAVCLGMDTTNMYTGAVRTVFNRCRFLNNAVVGAQGYGGAIHQLSTQAGASLHVRGCIIRGNYAR
jgi:hypothetical protein